jgi:hypothetical protein
LLGFTAPDATTPASPMSHCVPHAPPAQTCPLPHPVPSAALVHAVVLEVGVQLSHPSFSVVPDA